jgi:hypothetical protein
VTWGEIAQHIAGIFPDLDPTLRRQYLNIAYGEILDDRAWKQLEGVLTVRTIARYAEGSVNLLKGSPTVTGSGTAFTLSMAGRQFRASDDTNDIYTIAAVASATSLTLDRDFGGVDITAGGYAISQHSYDLPQAVREVTAVLPSFGSPLDELTQAEIERVHAASFLHAPPRAYSVLSDALPAVSPAVNRLRVFPAPDAEYDLRVVYLSAAAGFDGRNTGDSPLPWVSRAALLAKIKQYAYLEHLGDPNRASLQQMAFENAMHQMRSNDNLRTGAQPVKVHARLTPHYRRRGLHL